MEKSKIESNDPAQVNPFFEKRESYQVTAIRVITTGTVNQMIKSQKFMSLDLDKQTASFLDLVNDEGTLKSKSSNNESKLFDYDRFW